MTDPIKRFVWEKLYRLGLWEQQARYAYCILILKLRIHTTRDSSRFTPSDFENSADCRMSVQCGFDLVVQRGVCVVQRTVSQLIQPVHDCKAKLHLCFFATPFQLPLLHFLRKINSSYKAMSARLRTGKLLSSERVFVLLMLKQTL